MFYRSQNTILCRDVAGHQLRRSIRDEVVLSSGHWLHYLYEDTRGSTQTAGWCCTKLGKPTTGIYVMTISPCKRHCSFWWQIFCYRIYTGSAPVKHGRHLVVLHNLYYRSLTMVTPSMTLYLMATDCRISAILMIQPLKLHCSPAIYRIMFIQHLRSKLFRLSLN